MVSPFFQKREIFLFCYTAWPDHGVPETTEEILLFREVIRLAGYVGGKLLVHCSAGVGRTGTYLSIDRFEPSAFRLFVWQNLTSSAQPSQSSTGSVQPRGSLGRRRCCRFSQLSQLHGPNTGLDDAQFRY